MESWKCEIETHAMIWNIDLGVISIKEMIEGAGVDVSAKSEHKEKMARTGPSGDDGLPLDEERWGRMEMEVREEPEDLESLKTGQEFQERRGQ